MFSDFTLIVLKLAIMYDWVSRAFKKIHLCDRIDLYIYTLLDGAYTNSTTHYGEREISKQILIIQNYVFSEVLN